ncbi:MAG: fibronectin type III domain-containing protein, partial [Planctomycetota bacterium]
MRSRKEIRYVSEGKQRNGWSGGKAFAIGFTCTVAFCVATAFGMHVYIPFPEVSHTADVIFVGTVVDASPRLGPMGKMIFTDVMFEEIMLIRKKPGVSADVSKSVTLAFAGGQIGDRGVSVSGVPKFEVGQRYVVFSLMDGQPYANPLIGGSQGLFRVEVDASTGREYPVTPRGSGITSVSEGRLQLTRKLERIDGGVPVETPTRVTMVPAPQSSKGSLEQAWSRQVDPPDSILTLDEFVGEIRAILAEPAPVDGVLSRFSVEGGDKHSLQPFEGEPGGRTPKDGRIPMGPETVRPEPTMVLGEPGWDVNPLAGTALCYCGNWELFLTMEQESPQWASYSENEYAMWMWNRFMDIYRYVESDGSVGDNEDNEFAGFMDNATRQALYDSVWAGNIAVCILQWEGDLCSVHGYVQADILFNPAYTWSFDFNTTFNNPGLVLYRPVVLHELGHSWGFIAGSCVEDYSYDLPSVMHRYRFEVVENGRGIHAGDAWGIRNAYDSETSIIAIQDIGVESYYASSGLINSTTDKTNYDVGESITIQDYSVENMSNTAVSNLRIRFFLSTDRNITTSDYQVGGWWQWASFSSEGVWVGDTVTTIPVVPSGLYWLGAIVTRNGASYDSDDYPQNNSTFWPVQINVTCPESGMPSGVSATDGDCTYVLVTWDAAPNADEYRIYRDGSPIGSWQSGLSYDDYGASEWQVYNYQVKSRNECGESGLSSPDTGHRAAIPAAPTNVQASDGASCDYVLVTWTPGRAAEYIVKRDDMFISPWQTGNSYYDYSGDPGTVYTYRV